MSEITVYSKPACVQCTATYRAMDKAGLEYTVIDMSQDAEALELMKSRGYSQAPVIVVGDIRDNVIWTGFRPERIKELAALTAVA